VCGLVGYINVGDRPANEKITRDMGNLIAHRGPDGDGYWTDKNISLGHRRLAIIDLSEVSNQPMFSADGRYIMVYNGEIYNYLDIRKDLESRGQKFKTQGDSEVLLKAFEIFGPEAFLKLNGMFACAIMDRKSGLLTLARDRFGVKPLYYMAQNGVFAFASEIKAFKGHPELSFKLNPHGLSEYLTFMNFISDATLFKDVYLFPAGSYIQIDIQAPPSQGTKLKAVKFWDFEFTGDNPEYDKAALADEIHTRFQTAVRRQLVSDVGVSSFLSGGVDSGSITAVASEETSKLRTFTAFFDYEGASEAELKFDERAAAQLMARAFGTEHHEALIGPKDFQDTVSALCYHLDEPRVGQSYPNYLVSGLVKKFEIVTLSGAGGDELFGGYPWRYYQGLPADDFAQYVDGYYAYWRRLAATDQDFAVLSSPIAHEVKDYDGRAVFESIFPNYARAAKTPEAFLNLCLYFEAKTFMNGLLVVEDKVAMAHSLETRVPFLDNDLVELACRVPIQAKLDDIAGILERERKRKAGLSVIDPERRSDGKSILRYMMGRLVPEEIYKRDKQGFSAPDGGWFKNQCYDYIHNNLVGKKRRIHDFIDPTEIRSVVEGHKAGTRSDGRHKIWAFLHLAEAIDNFGL